MKYRNESETIDSEIWVAWSARSKSTLNAKNGRKTKREKRRMYVRTYMYYYNRLKDTRRCILCSLHDGNRVNRDSERLKYTRVHLSRNRERQMCSRSPQVFRTNVHVPRVRTYVRVCMVESRAWSLANCEIVIQKRFSFVHFPARMHVPSNRCRARTGRVVSAPVANTINARWRVARKLIEAISFCNKRRVDIGSNGAVVGDDIQI